ncbi:MAG: isoleucine--tRNA ligase [Rhizobiales bacterium]|nr:isoleucine--tRNA ligase [Hyphomicrobiales bacterium]
MSDSKTVDCSQADERDWRETLFLPQTSFPMKAGLPKREPDFLERWITQDIYSKLREKGKGRPQFILHDGPPYANGNIHIGHALNKTLKDIVARSQNMLGFDSPYVHGWDCHGLPIEWKVEEKYRKKQKNKDDIPVNEFRGECRAFADEWVGVQKEEMQRLGVQGEWDNSYKTMTFEAEKTIASELLKFAMNGTLYQDFKPVMWSVVEKTALAEAEVEYEDHESPTIFVKFPVIAGDDALVGANVVIWTTTPWTIPGNRAVAFGAHLSYGLYQVTEAPEDNWAKVGDKFLLCDALAEQVLGAAKVTSFERLQDVDPSLVEECAHPFRGQGYDFQVKLYSGDFVTDDAGTGFVHIAPGHGADDYGLYLSNQRAFREAGIEGVPQTVRPDGLYHEDVPLFGGSEPALVINQKGKFGNANKRVIEELVNANALIGRGKVQHSYPHSWRSKAPVIFRATPQWFIAIDKPIEIEGAGEARSIRDRALSAIEETQFVPEIGRNRLKAMVENRPDWVISRQRAWGVPICIFTNKETGEVIPSAEFGNSESLIKRIEESFEANGADAWFEAGAKEAYLDGLVEDVSDWDQVMDILDVWFDSGSTHAFVLEGRDGLRAPADLYLEGSDQHRGWFQSSLLESCGTRGHAPYKAVLTHGFTLDAKGKKMSKSLGNSIAPQKIIQQYGADILRLWVASTDYWEDQRIGDEMIKTSVESYRKLRNTLRFLLGNLHHYNDDLKVDVADMPELERVMLHRLTEMDALVREAYQTYEFKKAFHAIFQFCTVELSAFYFDIRKDTLYCEAHSSNARRASLTVLNELFNCLTAWLAPILVFTMEEVWQSRKADDANSVHLRDFPEVSSDWADAQLAEKWEKVRSVRRVVTGALEIERREKRIGSSLESTPEIFIADAELYNSVKDQDWAEIAITSGAVLSQGDVPKDAFTLDDVAGVGVVPKMAVGEKCARSWRVTEDVGSDSEFPALSARDAQAVREFDAL